MLNAWVIGFQTALSLIVAIGAQNAFVLRQGVRRVHVLPVVLICALSDAFLIGVGVFGLGILTDRIPLAAPVLRGGGIVFLTAYAARSFYSAWRGQQGLVIDDKHSAGLVKTVLLCLAITYLNPHVYLDTVLLIGSVATQFPGLEAVFWVGASSASLFFFIALGFGARFLAPVFARPVAWRILDVLIGCLMLWIAFTLLID